MARFYVSGTKFFYELDGDMLSVQHEDANADSCAGQGQVVSAWHRAAEQAGVRRDGELTHSGGFCSGRVVVAPVVADGDQRDEDE